MHCMSISSPRRRGFPGALHCAPLPTIGRAARMRRDHRLSRMLHVLLHLHEARAPITSAAIGTMLGTPAAIVRRTMAGLREHGIVESSKGHGGGWTLIRPLADITLLDVYRALDEPTLFALGPANSDATCLLERAADAQLGAAFERAAMTLRNELDATTLADLLHVASKDS